jgi:Fis family transcriptional regulator
MTTKRIEKREIQEALTKAMTDYIQSLDKIEEPSNVNRQVINAVEPIMLEIMMRYARNNQSRAAHCIGINRATLRTKLRRHNLM